MDLAVYSSEDTTKSFKLRIEDGISRLQEDLNLQCKKSETLEFLYGRLAAGACVSCLVLSYSVVVNFEEYNSDVIPATIAGEDSSALLKYLPQVFYLSLFHNLYVLVERGKNLTNLDCASLAVTSISSFVNIAILSFSTPVVVDHITGCEVSLLRWVEWTCLGFVMTALSCLSKPENLRHSMIMASVNSCSTAHGFLLPFITNPILWCLAFGIATTLFMGIYLDLFTKRRDVKDMKLRLKAHTGRKHIHLQNELEIKEHNYRITKWMVSIWTTFVLIFLFETFMSRNTHEPKALRKWFVVLECILDTFAKQIYSRYLTNIMSTLHNPIKVTSSRLQSLQEQIEIIWENAQDALIILREREGEYLLSYNGTFNDLFGENGGKNESFINFLREVISGNKHNEGKLISHMFTLLNGNTINTEISLKRMESEKAIVMIVRDVSSRIRELTLEKEYYAEKVAREKDLESSSFMRHETKNHLLNIRVLLHQINEMLVQNDPKGGTLKDTNDIEEEKISHLMTKLELENEHALLNVMRYSLMKEIAYGEYECSLKSTTMRNLLEAYQGSQKVIVNPNIYDMPDIITDEFLVQIIFQNAVSNALKYGNKKAKVTIEGDFHPTNKTIEFVVSNLPGENARTMMRLPDKSVVFKRKRSMDCTEHNLQESEIPNGERNKNSSTLGGRMVHKISTGHGGWIMKKCTSLLKGECSYHFEETVTKFVVNIPVQLTSSAIKGKDSASVNEMITTLSNNILVVSLDDSSIQRLMVKRLFSTMQIPCVVTGETAEEAMNFPEFVKKTSRENPDRKLVILVDENLDYTESDQYVSISGSSIIPGMKKACEENHPDVLILMRTANDSKREMSVFRERGAHGSFEKLIRTADAVVQALSKHGLVN